MIKQYNVISKVLVSGSYEICRIRCLSELSSSTDKCVFIGFFSEIYAQH